MSKKFTLKFYADPGHGWVCVKVSFAKELGILSKVSEYSYIKGRSIFLEEDGDLSLLCNAIKANGDTFEFNEKHTDKRSPIRSYNCASQENILKALND